MRRYSLRAVSLNRLVEAEHNERIVDALPNYEDVVGAAILGALDLCRHYFPVEVELHRTNSVTGDVNYLAERVVSRISTPAEVGFLREDLLKTESVNVWRYQDGEATDFLVVVHISEVV